MQLVVVDAANVMGSRPDGWWRDRAGAARRLHDELLAASPDLGEVALVVEGKARGGPPAGRQGRVRTVHAPGSGDDTVVDEVVSALARDDECRVVAVTSDRALRDRVTAVGGRCEGPRWLLEQTAAGGSGTHRSRP